jgi:HEAT repeat protein
MNPSNNDFENPINDSKSTKEIIQLACREEDEDTYWDMVWILQKRGSDEEFAAASKLCESENPKERSLGVDILAQLGIPERTFPQQCGDIILKLLSSEEDSNVLASIGFAFGHSNDSRSVSPLVKFKDHPDANVRLGVVFGLTCQENELAIQALIDLSSDEDKDVRNWATFGLGSQIEADTQAIRDALFQRVMLETGEDDTIAEIRGEALLGLAVRKDERVINPLIAELNCGRIGRLSVEAAKEIGDARLYPALIDLQKWWDIDSKLLQEAIYSCNSQ